MLSLRVVVAVAFAVCAVAVSGVTAAEAEAEASEAASLQALEALSAAEHISGLSQALQLTGADAEQFAVLQELQSSAAAAGASEPARADATAILESVYANIESEQARASRRFAARKAAYARKARRTRRVLRNLKRSAVADARRLAATKRRVRTNEQRLKRTRSDLAVAVQRHLAARNDVDKAVAKKMQRVRALNNQILDAQTRVRALKAIAAAVLEAHPPQTPPRVFLQQHLQPRVADGALNPVFLQIGDEFDAEAGAQDQAQAEAEAEDESALEAEAAAEAEAEAEAEAAEEAEDADAAEDEGEALSDAEAADELQATAEAITANDDEADEADGEAEQQELDDEAEAAADEAVDTAAEAEAGDATAVEAAGQARMLQVLQTLSATLPGDGSVTELIALLNDLISGGRAQLQELMAARAAALGDFRVRTTELRKVAIRARLRVERLRRRVHALERRTRRLVRRAQQLKSNLKENGVQTTLYERRLATLTAHFAQFKAQYKAASKRRAMHLKSIRKLQQRLEALAASRGGAAVTIDANVVGGAYRWEATAWKECSAECTEITPRALTAKGDSDVAPHTQPPTNQRKLKRRVTTRDVKCFDFAHTEVDAAKCAALPQPRRTKKCPVNPCPRDCTVSSWHWPKECSNSCGTGTRIAHRNILQPERFGGACPQRAGLKGGLRKAKQCFAVKGCTSVKAKRRAFRELRKRNAEQKANGTAPKPDPRHLPQPGDDQTHVWRPWLKRVAGAKGKGKGKGTRRIRRQRRQRKAQAKQNVAGMAPVKTVSRLPQPKGASKRERRVRRERAAAKAKAKAAAKARREKRRRQRRQRRAAAKRRAQKQRLAKLNRKREAKGLPPLQTAPGSKAPAAAAQQKPPTKQLTKQQRRAKAVRAAQKAQAQERARLERKLQAAQRADGAAPAVVKRQRTEAERAAVRAKVARCGKCRGSAKGKKCRAKHCAVLSKLQRLQAVAIRCKRCRSGKAGKQCRQTNKCKARLAKLKALKAKRAAKKAAAAAAAAAAQPPATANSAAQKSAAKRAAVNAKVSRCAKCRGGDKGKKCRAKQCAGLSKFQRLRAAVARCKRCRSGKKGKACRKANKCAERRAKLKAQKAKRAAAKAAAAKSAAAKAAAAPLPPAVAKKQQKKRFAPSAIPSPVSPRQHKAAFWYRPDGAQATADGAVTVWRDSTEFGRDLTSVGGADPEVAPQRRAGKRAVLMNHTGMQSRRLRLGDQFDVIAVLRFDGDPKAPANRWGAASAFTVNAPKKTPANPFEHGTSGGVGVAVTDGQFRIVAEGKQWSPTGVDVTRGTKYVVRLRRSSPTEFELFVGPPSADGPILPSARLSSDIIEDDSARLKIGVSDALYYGWEGAVFEVIGFNGLISDAHVRRNYERLRKAYDLL